ncbi:MAG: hypothetical protein FJ011_17835 [Chloroflexi bacterium]|nr:hypothetical protein [Chloroflexota bacterium]
MEIIILATVMAFFGVLGYQRGSRSMLFTSVITGGALLAFARAGPTIVKYINTMYMGTKIGPGAIQALASGDAKALDKLFASLKAAKPLIPTDNAGFGLSVVLLILIGLSLWASRIKYLRGAPSVMGLLFGVINGYLASAHLLNAMSAGSAWPLPFGLSKPAAPAAAAAGAAPGGDLVDRLLRLVTQTMSDQTLAVVIILAIALFVFLATRFSNKPAKKG